VSGITHTWMHGASPIEAMTINDKLERLKEDLAKGPFFQNKIKEYFLDNPHHITIVMRPGT